MRKKRSVPLRVRLLLASLSLLLVATGVSLFFLITNGRTVNEDGLTQNSRVYITDISASKETETLSFTLHNGTRKTLTYGVHYIIETKKDGEWVTATPRTYRVIDISCRHAAFKNYQRSRDFLAEEQLAGEYRVYLRFGDGKHGWYAVGYFNIS